MFVKRFLQHQHIHCYQHFVITLRRSMTMYKTSVKNILPSTNLDHVADLRSDTMTKPCKNMRQAMMSAPVGDDVFEEDPTVKALEARTAEMTNKEAGLFVISGTMGNFLSVLSHTGRRGAEVLLGDESHIFLSEQGNIAQFGGVNPHVVHTKKDGTFCLEQLQHHIRSADFHHPSTQLLCIENTHGNLGGKVLPLEWIDKACDFAHENNFPVHMDGARLFNASIATKESVSRILQNVDSASICMSKNLGAPIGSVIVGQREFIDRARYLRKGLGGGWRQAGIVAAAGLYAIENNIERLADDHSNATKLASVIHNLGSLNVYVKPEDVETNMVFVYVNPNAISSVDFVERMQQVGDGEESVVGSRVCVKALPQSTNSVRFVFHLDISQEQMEAAVAKITYIVHEIDRQISSHVK